MEGIRLNDNVQEHVQLALDMFKHQQNYNGSVEFSEDDPGYREMLAFFKEKRTPPEVIYFTVNELLSRYTKLTPHEKQFATHIVSTQKLIAKERDEDGGKFIGIRDLLKEKIQDTDRNEARIGFAEASLAVEKAKASSARQVNRKRAAILSELVSQTVATIQTAAKTSANANRKKVNISKTDKINQQRNEINIASVKKIKGDLDRFLADETPPNSAKAEAAPPKKKSPIRPSRA